MEADYKVKLEVFEGPLDLLLYLIKKEEVDIYDIPIERITNQYMEYLTLMKLLNLEVAGEFLVMAATLMYIKSRMLLPVDQQITDSEAVEGTYEFFAKRLARSPRTELEGIKNILTSIGAGQRNAAEFVDMSLIDEIEKEGFVQKLYGN